VIQQAACGHMADPMPSIGKSFGVTTAIALGGTGPSLTGWSSHSSVA
jgi:hypothetical protein